VFKVNNDGSDYQVIHKFSEPSGGEGRVPQALIEGSDGALYGIASEREVREMRVFTLNRDGSGYRVLYSFTAGADKYDPNRPSALVQGRDGVLYGTSAYGGAYTNQYGRGYGTVFKLNHDGSGYSVLHNFGGTGDDSYPVSLIEATDGALYGNTGEGTLFKLNRDGSGYTLLGSTGLSYGNAWSPIVEGTDGLLYGATSSASDSAARERWEPRWAPGHALGRWCLSLPHERQ
jgi:hypothetical protein